MAGASIGVSDEGQFLHYRDTIPPGFDCNSSDNSDDECTNFATIHTKPEKSKSVTYYNVIGGQSNQIGDTTNININLADFDVERFFTEERNTIEEVTLKITLKLSSKEPHYDPECCGELERRKVEEITELMARLNISVREEYGEEASVTEVKHRCIELTISIPASQLQKVKDDLASGKLEGLLNKAILTEAEQEQFHLKLHNAIVTQLKSQMKDCLHFVTGMEPADKHKLVKNHNLLVANIRLEHIIGHLIQDEVIKKEEYQELQNETTPQSKIRKLIVEILPTKGPKAYSSFRNSLTDNYGYIVERLDMTEYRKPQDANRQGCAAKNRIEVPLEYKDILDDKKWAELVEMECSEKQIRMQVDKKRKEVKQCLNNYRLPANWITYKNVGVPGIVNVVLVGKTGEGKSATANTLINKKGYFEESDNAAACTQVLKTGFITDRNITYKVIDTPGLFDTSRKSEDVMMEIAKVIDECRDGVHAFLYVHDSSVIKFTDQEKEVVEAISNIFGKNVWEYCGLVLTHGEQRFKERSLKHFLDEGIKGTYLERFVEMIDWQVIAINNKPDTLYEYDIVRASLFEMIYHIQARAKFNPYTQSIFQEAKCLKKQLELDEKLKAEEEVKLRQREFTENLRKIKECAKDSANIIIRKCNKMEVETFMRNGFSEMIVGQINEMIRSTLKQRVFKDIDEEYIKETIGDALREASNEWLNLEMQQTIDRKSREAEQAYEEQVRINMLAEINRLKQEMAKNDAIEKARMKARKKAEIRRQQEISDEIKRASDEMNTEIANKCKEIAKKSTAYELKNLSDKDYEEYAKDIYSHLQPTTKKHFRVTDVSIKLEQTVEREKEYLEELTKYRIWDYLPSRCRVS